MRRAILATTATIVALGCGGEDAGQAPVAFERVDRPTFDSGRAYADLLRQVEFGPRYSGTEGHAAQIDWMVSELRALADTVYTDEWEYTTRPGVELQLTNVIARFGPSEGRPVLLTAHWDTRPWASEADDPEEREEPILGANDGASGVAVLMELARMFAAQPPPTGVIVLLTDGEDYGPDTADMFLGAKHYGETRAAADDPLYGILLDMVGDADPLFPVEAYSVERAPQVVQRVWGMAHQLGYRRYFPRDRSVRVIDDHVPLNEAGVPTIDIIDFDYGPGNSYWHTLQDVPSNTSAQTLAMVGDVVAEVVYRQR